VFNFYTQSGQETWANRGQVFGDTSANTGADSNMFDALKMIPNLPSSLAKNLVAPLEPLGEIKEAVSGGIKDFGGGVGGALKLGAQTALEVPGAAIQVGGDIAKGLASFFGIDKASTGDVKGGMEALYRNMVNDPVGFYAALQGLRGGTKAASEIAKTGEVSKGFEAGRTGLNEPITKNIPQPGMDILKEKTLGTPEALKTIEKASSLESLKDKISPKITTKEAKLATDHLLEYFLMFLLFQLVLLLHYIF